MKLAIRLFLIVIIFGVGLMYFRAITHLSGTGEVIVGLESQTKELEKQNRVLLVLIGDHDLLGAVDAEAQKIGMVGTSKFVYLQTTPSSLAVSKR